jgi:hypothetical protein
MLFKKHVVKMSIWKSLLLEREVKKVVEMPKNSKDTQKMFDDHHSSTLIKNSSGGT